METVRDVVAHAIVARMVTPDGIPPTHDEADWLMFQDDAFEYADAAIFALANWLSLQRSDEMIDAVAKAIGTATPNHNWANSAIAAMAAMLSAAAGKS